MTARQSTGRSHDWYQDRLNPNLSRLDQFAEYLAEGYSPSDSAEMAGMQRSSGNAMVQRLRKRLGAQAI